MTSFQKFRLRWDNHTSNFLGSLGSLLNSENYSDVTVCCEGQVWQLHRLVLSASSCHFENLLNSIPVGLTPAIILDGPSSSDIGALIHFIYHGEVSVDQDSLPSLLRTAGSLKIKGLADVSSFAQSDAASQVVRFVPPLDESPTSLDDIDNSPLNLSCHPDKKVSIDSTPKRKLSANGIHLTNGQPEHVETYQRSFKKARTAPHPESPCTTTATQTKASLEYTIPTVNGIRDFHRPLAAVCYDSAHIKSEPANDVTDKLAIGTQTACNYREVVYIKNPSNLPVVVKASQLPAVALMEPSPPLIPKTTLLPTLSYQQSSISSSHTVVPVTAVDKIGSTPTHRVQFASSHRSQVSMPTSKTPVDEISTDVEYKQNSFSPSEVGAIKVLAETTFNHKKFSPCTIPSSTLPTGRPVYNTSLLNGSSYKIVNSTNTKDPKPNIDVSTCEQLSPRVNSSTIVTESSKCNSHGSPPLVSQIPRVSETFDELRVHSPSPPRLIVSSTSLPDNFNGSPLDEQSRVNSPGFKSPTESSDEHCSDNPASTACPSNNDAASSNSQRVTINMRTFKEEWRKQLLVDYDSRTNMSICMLCFTTFKSYDGPRKNTYVKHAKRFHPALDDYSDEERGVIISMYEKYHKYDIDMQKEINKTFRAPNGSGCVMKRSSKGVDTVATAHVGTNGITNRCARDTNQHNTSNDYSTIKDDTSVSDQPNTEEELTIKAHKNPNTKFNNNDIELNQTKTSPKAKATKSLLSVSASA